MYQHPTHAHIGDGRSGKQSQDKFYLKQPMGKTLYGPTLHYWRTCSWKSRK